MWAKLVFYVIMCGMIIPCAVAGQATRRTIKDTDFNNFTYHYLGQAFLVQDGLYESADKDAMESLEVVSIKFGCLTQRTHEDAVVFTRYNGGGSGLFDALYLFQLENGQPVLVTMIEGGDRAIGGIKDFYIKDETLYIVSHDRHRNACRACFDYESTTEWKWNEHKRTAAEAREAIGQEVHGTSIYGRLLPVKSFNLRGLTGISHDTLEMHFKQ